MNIRTLILAAATVAALSPSLSTASPEKDSLKACANAFASTMASPGAAAPGYKLAYRDGIATPTIDYPRDYTFMLEAHDKGGVAIARARCSADASGRVTELSALPLRTKVVYPAY